MAQRFAITGSMDQRGFIQAVGGVNEKIEGFYNVCKARGGDTVHGVIIPTSNRFDINLNDEVVEACTQGKFEIYTVNTFYEAIQLLTGHDWEKGKKPLRAEILKTLQHFRKISKPDRN